MKRCEKQMCKWAALTHLLRHLLLPLLRHLLPPGPRGNWRSFFSLSLSLSLVLYCVVFYLGCRWDLLEGFAFRRGATGHVHAMIYNRLPTKNHTRTKTKINRNKHTPNIYIYIYIYIYTLIYLYIHRHASMAIWRLYGGPREEREREREKERKEEERERERKEKEKPEKCQGGIEPYASLLSD